MMMSEGECESSPDALLEQALTEGAEVVVREVTHSHGEVAVDGVAESVRGRVPVLGEPCHVGLLDDPREVAGKLTRARPTVPSASFSYTPSYITHCTAASRTSSMKISLPSSSSSISY